MFECFKPHWDRWVIATETKSRDYYEGHAWVNLFAEGLRCRSTRLFFVLAPVMFWVGLFGGLIDYWPFPVFLAVVSLLVPEHQMLRFIKLRIPGTTIGAAHISAATPPWGLMFVPIAIAYFKNKKQQ